MTTLTELSTEELEAFTRAMGMPAYRARQIHKWIYQAGCGSFDRMTDLPKDLRARLSAEARVRSLEEVGRQVSEDGTEKFLFRLSDTESVESVLMFDADRTTLCVSSQVGCAMGCRFCVTGALGFRRNLQAHEIVEQVLHARERLRPESDLTNIVFMGMGEPFQNFEEVQTALGRLISPGYVGLSKRKVTVSTCGHVEGIQRLGREGPIVNLAISLNATTDETRSRLMPVNRKWPLKELLRACREFPLKPTRRITFEYVLFAGVNDTLEDARRLVRLLKGIRSKVNLIPFNPHPGSEFSKPGDEQVLAFQQVLVEAGLTAPVRKSKGADIAAACGQLKAAYTARQKGPKPN